MASPGGISKTGLKKKEDAEILYIIAHFYYIMLHFGFNSHDSTSSVSSSLWHKYDWPNFCKLGNP